MLRFIELLVLLMVVIATINAAPVIEKRDVVNADTPFDSEAFAFDPKMHKREAGKRIRHHIRSSPKPCCGFGLGLKADISIIGENGNKPEHASPPAPAAPSPPAPNNPPTTPSVGAPVANGGQDIYNININNNNNH